MFLLFLNDVLLYGYNLVASVHLWLGAVEGERTGNDNLLAYLDLVLGGEFLSTDVVTTEDGEVVGVLAINRYIICGIAIVAGIDLLDF